MRCIAVAFFTYIVIPKERSDCGTAAIKPRAKGACRLCRGGAVKTGDQSPTFILITIMKIATACTKPRNDGLFCKPLAFFGFANSDGYHGATN